MIGKAGAKSWLLKSSNVICTHSRVLETAQRLPRRLWAQKGEGEKHADEDWGELEGSALEDLEGVP